MVDGHRILSISKLIAVVIALALVVSAPAAFGASGPDLLGLAGFDVSRIEIERENQSVVLQKDGAEWDVVLPVQDRADQQAVTNLLNRLANLTIADELSGDHPEFGFDPPRAIVRLVDRAEVSKGLLIGNLRSPVSLFVKASDSDVVYAISNVSLAGIGEYPMAFVDSNLMRVNPDDVSRIRVESAIATDDDDRPDVIQIEREGAAWVFESGAVAFDVNHFLRSVRLIQASGQIESGYAGAQFYPAPGTTRLTLDFEEGTQVVLDVGTATDDGHHYYFRVSGRDDIYVVPAFHAQHIVRQALGINDSLLSFDPERVKELSISAGPEGTRTVFTRNSSGAWESNRTVVFNFEPLLDAVRSVGANRRLPEQEGVDYGFGTDPNAIDVNVVFTDGNRLTLSLGAPVQDGSEVYLKTSSRDGIYVGPASAADELLDAASRVRSRLFPASLSDVTYIRIQRGSGSPEGTLIERSGDGWVRAGTSVDASRVETLVNALVGLGADSLPPLPDDPNELGFYPSANSTRITVGFSDDTERYLDIGAAVQVGSGWFATTSYYAHVSDLEDTVAFVREQVIRNIVNAAGALE